MKRRIFAVFAVLVLILSACGKSPADDRRLPSPISEATLVELYPVDETGFGQYRMYCHVTGINYREIRIKLCGEEGMYFTAHADGGYFILDKEDYNGGDCRVIYGLYPGEELKWARNPTYDEGDLYVEIRGYTEEEQLPFGFALVRIAPMPEYPDIYFADIVAQGRFDGDVSWTDSERLFESLKDRS